MKFHNAKAKSYEASLNEYLGNTMIKHYPHNSLGSANHGWLKSKHHFSFANYYNPTRMGFGTLRVVNDDWVAPGTGFPAHPHQNMEIISFIRSGAVTHQDSTGNKGITKEGDYLRIGALEILLAGIMAILCTVFFLRSKIKDILGMSIITGIAEGIIVYMIFLF